MKNLIKVLLLSVILIAICHSVIGVIAYPYPVDIIQPDGTKITIILKGDEHVKWAVTTDGYTILLNSKGIYEYAVLNSVDDLVPSGIPVRNQNERNSSDIQFLNRTGKDLTYSESQVEMMRSISKMYEKSAEKVFPTKGSRKLVCILVGFSDKAFTKTKADFENLFNQVGYNADGAAGSVYDFYKENSFSQLDLTVTVAGPYTAANTVAYYGGNDSNGNDLRPRELVTEAVTLADPLVNYADFDNDGDGTVDGVYVIYGGYGEEAGGASAIWAHAWSITPLTLDGKTVSKYSCSPELRGNSGTGLTRIGVICHEFGHVMGAMDYYDVDYSVNGQFTGTGKWDLMANGSWNNSGTTPAHHNPYTKVFSYGWAEAPVLTSATSINITLNDAEQNSNSFYRINTVKSNEYFLIENRQQYKFDTYIPGHGMIIYHVDGNYISTAGNQINAGIHQGMYPVCANATGNPTTTYGVIDNNGLPFPGSGIKTSFTDATTPNSKCWLGANTNKPITNITENITLKTVSFSYIVNLTAPTAITSSTSGISPVSAKINGLVSGNGASTTISFEYGKTTSYGNTVNGTPGTVTGENLTDITANLTGLTANTVYNYRIKAVNSIGTTYGSNMTFNTVKLAQPGGLTAAIQNPELGTVKLDWKYGGAGIFEDFENGTADNFVFYDNRTFIENSMLTASATGNNTWAEAYYNKNFQDFTLEYRVRRNQGSASSSIGLMFRSTGLNNTSNITGYLFNITAGGSYSAWKLTSGVASSLIPWTSSSAIKSGIDSWNIVTIEARGNNVKFYINSQYVNQITDATYTSGRIVFGAYMSSGYTHKVNWDEISIIPQAGVLKNPSGLVKAINTILDDSGTSDKAPENMSVNNNNNVEVKGLINEVNAIAMPFRYFKIYRNGIKLDTTSLTTYSSSLPSYGMYEYKVTANYDLGESDPAGPVSIGWYGDPIISVNPLSFNETLMSGDSISRDLTIKNNGNGMLIYTIPKIAVSKVIKPAETINIATGNTSAKENKSLDTSDESQPVVISIPKIMRAGSDKNVLIFRDNLAWGYNVNIPVLTSLGANVSIAGSSSMGTINLSDYQLIVFESQQPTSFYNSYKTNLSRFQAYLNSGGVIEFHCATWTSYRVSNLPFPGGLQTSTTEDPDNNNYIVNASHPIVNGVTGTLAGNQASLEALTNIPAGADIITNNESGLPTTVEYNYGLGTMIVTSMTWEWAYQNNQNFSRMLANCMQYALTKKANTWLSASVLTDTLLSGESSVIKIKFNAKDLVSDDYTDTLRISSTDLNNPGIKVPCTLHVLGKPTVNFAANSTQILIGDNLQFTDLTSGSPTSWKWRFPSGSPSASTEQNPIIAYSSLGTFNVTLIATNGYGSDSITKIGYVTVKNMQYCTSNLGGSGSCPGDISLVSIAGTSLNNTDHSICSTANSSTYASYLATGNTTGSIQKGMTYQLSVTTTNSDIISVWIDYNHNSVFDATEWTQVSTSTVSNVPSTKSITIPQTAFDGITGMRIRTRSLGSTNGATDACSYFSSGITEDYIITIGLSQTPTLDTSPVSAITLTSAISGGNITSDGNASITARGVCWSTTANPTIALTTKTTDGTGIGTFTSSISGLTPGITYHIRAYATNIAGTAYGTDITFTTCTAAVIPTLTTNPVSSITLNAGLSGGNITSGGCATITARGICWSTTSNPTIALTTKTTDGTGTGNFISNITVLAPGVTYHVRAYATNSAGTGYGSDISFTSCTVVVLPTITTTSVSAITSVTATTGGNIASGGCAEVIAKGVCWSISVNPTAALNTKTNNGTGEGSFISNITGLTGGTTYHVRAYATNSAGTGYGADISFTCLPYAPMATSPTNITQTSFTAHWNSSLAATGYYLDVSTNSGFITYLSGFNSKDIGNLTSTVVAGLNENSTYYYRVRAYGSGGTSTNSNIITLTTLPNPPSAPIAGSATNILQTSFTANWNNSVAATGYQLDVSTTSTFTTFISGFNSKDIGNTTSISVTGLIANTTYYYRVRAYNIGGVSLNSGTISTTTLPNTPPAPLANSATNIVQTSFTSNWTSSATATGYRLDVSTNSAFTSFLTGYNNKDIGNQLSSSITGLTAKTTYYYRLRSYNTGGPSASSNIITVTTLTVPPASPTGLTVSSCNNLVTLKWRKNTETNFSRYRIYGGTANNPTIKIDSAINASSDTITKVISGLTHGLTYYFRVTAVNYDGPESPFSSQSSATVKTGVIPKIKSKWGDVLICSNLGDSITGFRWYKGNSLISFATSQYYVTNKQPGIYNVETIDISGCKNSSNAISTSGTKSLSAYPNPASVNFSLKLNDVSEGRAVISILTSVGIKVMEFEVENVTGELLKEIPVNNLDEGIYIVQVLLDNKDIYFTKIIVKK